MFNYKRFSLGFELGFFEHLDYTMFNYKPGYVTYQAHLKGGFRLHYV